MITQTKEIIFLLADDHSIVRHGIEIIIHECISNPKIYYTASLHQIEELVKLNSIEILITDAHFPDGNSLSIIPKLRSDNPNLKILIFSGLEEHLHALKFINAGANGYLSKLSEEEDVKNAILSMVEKGEYLSVTLQELLIKYIKNPDAVNPLNNLSKRELQIAEMYAEGYGNLEIANLLDIKQNTVSTIKKNIFDKLKIENIVELIDIIKTHHKI